MHGRLHCPLPLCSPSGRHIADLGDLPPDIDSPTSIAKSPMRVCCIAAHSPPAPFAPSAEGTPPILETCRLASMTKSPTWTCRLRHLGHKYGNILLPGRRGRRKVDDASEDAGKSAQHSGRRPLSRRLGPLDGQWTPAGQGRAGQGRAGQGRAGQGRAGQGKAGQGRARPGKAGQGKAGQSQARPGKAGPGKAEPGRARQGKAEPGRARPGRAARPPGKGRKVRLWGSARWGGCVAGQGCGPRRRLWLLWPGLRWRRPAMGPSVG